MRAPKIIITNKKQLKFLIFYIVIGSLSAVGFNKIMGFGAMSFWKTTIVNLPVFVWILSYWPKSEQKESNDNKTTES
jgi:hypothetical protein